MARGGSRTGAGRHRGEPTRSVRVAARAALAARGVTDYFLRIVEDAFREKYAQRIASNDAAPIIELIGLEEVDARSLMGGAARIPVLVATAVMDGIRGTFEVGLDGRGLVVRSEDHVE